MSRKPIYLDRPYIQRLGDMGLLEDSPGMMGSPPQLSFEAAPVLLDLLDDALEAHKEAVLQWEYWQGIWERDRAKLKEARRLAEDLKHELIRWCDDWTPIPELPWEVDDEDQ